MLVSMKAILEDANTNYYGVMAMNSINIEMARAASWLLRRNTPLSSSSLAPAR